TILSDALIIEKTKLLVGELKIPEDSEEASTDQNVIIESLPLLQDICEKYPFNRIYNMDEIDDQIIKKLAYTFKKDDSVKSADKNVTKIDDEDNSIKIITVSDSSALNNLENICIFLLQQEGSGEQFKLVNFLEKFVRNKIISLA
ncbi:12601_t:CDS:2, partial [Cetraspora pellucida]